MPYNILGDLQTLTLSPSAECDNPCCILTINNDVMLMGNISLTNYQAGTMFATLPESMRPTDNVMIPAFLGETLVRVTLNPDGELSIARDVNGETLYMNGVSFNVCDRYYNSSIGNNFSQGTSPLRWDSEEY
ncbi:hypothetical protein [Methanomethylophilus alvi]|uniref:hypothetical protein n=1 Tax=Methanomethylophilus alvi TaxID=1291540 RepID=UPI0037DD882F